MRIPRKFSLGLLLLTLLSMPTSIGASTEWAGECNPDSFISVSGVVYQESYPWTVSQPFANVKVYLDRRVPIRCGWSETAIDSTISGVTGAYRFPCVSKNMLDSSTIEVMASPTEYNTAALQLNDTSAATSDLHVVPQGAPAIFAGTVSTWTWDIATVPCPGLPGCSGTRISAVKQPLAGATVIFPASLIYSTGSIRGCLEPPIIPAAKRLATANDSLMVTDAAGHYSIDFVPPASFWQGRAIISMAGYDTVSNFMGMGNGMRIDTEYVLRKHFIYRATKSLPNLNAIIYTSTVFYHAGDRLYVRLNVTGNLGTVNGILAPAYPYMSPGRFTLLVKDSSGTQILQLNEPPPVACSPTANCITTGTVGLLQFGDTLSYDFPPELVLQPSNQWYTVTGRFNDDTATDVSAEFAVLATGAINPLVQNEKTGPLTQFLTQSHRLMISAKPGVQTSVTVYRGDGKLVSSLSGRSTSGALVISLANEPAGIYLAIIRSNGESKTLRLLNSSLSR